MNKRIIAIAIASVFSAAGAVAGEGGYMGGSSGATTQGQSMHGQTMSEAQFRNLDTNNDGYLSQEEVEAHEWLTERLAEDWNEADVNKDGKVDEAEFAAFEQQQMEEQRRQEMESLHRRPGDRLD